LPIIAFVVSSAVLATTARGAQEKLLLPIAYYGQVPGAFGSLWKVELSGRNAGSSFVRVGTKMPCAVNCPNSPAQPHSDFFVDLSFTKTVAGHFIYVDSAGAESVSFNLRVQDVSRQALTWGTELPVVRSSDAFTAPVSLINVPSDSRFRVAVRVYDFDGTGANRVRLRIFPFNSSDAIVDDEVALTTQGFSPEELPPQAQITDLTGRYPTLRDRGPLRIEVIPVTSPLRFWAFVSVTNDETQHVTTITPQ
jgi:hypothetical protein